MPENLEIVAEDITDISKDVRKELLKTKIINGICEHRPYCIFPEGLYCKTASCVLGADRLFSLKPKN